MSAGEWRVITGWSRPRSYQPATKFFAPSQLRQMRGCEQVAAICYRVRGSSIEFLLVQTRGGRWTFPKGSAEPGLTHAQAAALEAFEEAGVHGRMEEVSFTRYVRRKSGGPADPVTPEIAVNAHLCEVLWLGPPQESDRNPTWFTADKAKRRLRQDRTPGYGAELARVVDRAMVRIRRVRSGASADALQKVQFAVENAREITARTRAAASSRKRR